MKAIVARRYGPPEILRLEEVEKPVPKENEVLIQVHAASVNAADWHLLTADIFLIRLMGEGLFKPKHSILGADIAGRVEACGTRVSLLRPGDEVFGDIAGCGWGGLAEYVCVREDAVLAKPRNLSFEEAAAVPLAAVTALKALRDKGRIRQGQKVLINGASGGVGSFALQLAKVFGAELTAVCSDRNAEQARALGADRVIDYAREDFTRSGERYDLIVAANGYHPISDYKRALSPTGTYVMTGGSPAQMFQALILGPLLSKTGGKQITSLSSEPNIEDLAFLRQLIEEGRLRPVIDRRYPLSEAAEALRYLGAGHAKGKVVVTVER